MSAIVTTLMRIYSANQFKAGFADAGQKLYLFIGRTLPWVNDAVPPAPVDCIADEIAAFDDMLSLKLIDSTDVSLVVPRNTWVVNTIYSQYSNTVSLFDVTPSVYVTSDQLNVYKCLSNN